MTDRLRGMLVTLVTSAWLVSGSHPSTPLAAFPPRPGPVRVEGRAFADAGGVFNPLGASFFWLAWGVKFDRARVEANLQTLSDAGVDYVRALGVVGPGGGWTDREVDPRWPDYTSVIQQATDLAYDRFGIRVQWTIFGGVDRVPTREARAAVVDRFAQLARGREQKLMLFEIANEGWHTGFEGTAGRAELRALGQRLSAATSVLVALTAPDDADLGVCPLYAGSGADVMTWHHDRSRSGAAGPWGPVIEPGRVRRELERLAHAPNAGCVGQLPMAIVNNEPIGPGSSIEEERDPTRLALAYVLTFAFQHAAFVLHTGPGIRGGGAEDRERGRPANFADLSEFTAIARAMAGVRRSTPAGLANWTLVDPHDRATPVQGLTDAIARGDLVEAVLTRKDVDLFGALVAVRHEISLRAPAAMTVEILDPATGDVLKRLDVSAGSDFSITPRAREGGDALLIRAHVVTRGPSDDGRSARGVPQ